VIMPATRIATPIAHVFFPAFSRVSEPARIATMWTRANRMVALIIVPSMLGLIAVAPEFVRVVFGEKWSAAIPVIQILATVGLIQGLFALNAPILQALDRTSTLFRFTSALSALTVIGFAAGLPWGIEGVAVGFLVVSVATAPVYLRLTTDAVGLPASVWLRSVAGVLQSGIAMMLIVLGARELLVGAGVAEGALLAILVVLGAAVYLGLVLWRDPEVAAEIGRLRERRRSGATPELEGEAELPNPAALPPAGDL